MDTILTFKNIDLASWLSRALNTVGFVAVAVAVVAVCNARLDGLRNAQDYMPPGYKTAAEQTRQL
jgi:3'-phosphoadenosine 5'-phosphosulfate sulfotransferase